MWDNTWVKYVNAWVYIYLSFFNVNFVGCDGPNDEANFAAPPVYRYLFHSFRDCAFDMDVLLTWN